MAHWSSGHADFHDELYAEPPTPFFRRSCTREVRRSFTQLSELRRHVFEMHPVTHPGLAAQVGSVAVGLKGFECKYAGNKDRDVSAKAAGHSVHFDNVKLV